MPYSPWMDAANATQHIGNTMNNTLAGLAQLRFSNNARLQDLSLRAAMAMNQQAESDAQRQLYLAKAATEKRQQEVAAALGAAMRRRVPMNPMAGPTIQNAEALTMGDIAANAAESGALAGHGMNLLMPHNVGQNDISVNALGQEVARGPVVVSENAMYDYGNKQVRNPGRVSLAPGHQSFDPNGGPTYTNNIVRPGSEQNAFAAMLNYIRGANTPVDAENEYPLRDMPLYQNIVDLAGQQATRMRGGTQPGTQTASAKRRVQGPNGETGTVDANEELPEGWSYIQ